MLDDHIESEHTKKDHPPEKHDCEKCEQTFPTSLHLEFHICKPAYKYPCHVCEFMGLSVLEVLTHLNEDHVKCLKCNHMSKTKKGSRPASDLILHFCEHRQAEHPNLVPIFKPKSTNMALSLGTG